MSKSARRTSGRKAANPSPRPQAMRLAIGLALAGLLVAGYMAVSDLTGSEIQCGALGDCTATHASAYGAMFSIPVSLLGTAAYLAILILLLASKALPTYWRGPALHAAFAFGLAGAMFSLYLTAVSVFVLQSICPWCIVSAIVITTLAYVLWQVTGTLC